MTPTHPDLAQQIAVALERAGIKGWTVGRADPESCWLDGRYGTFLLITPGRFDVGKSGSVGVETERIVSLVRACMKGGTPARLAVEAGVAFELGEMLRWCMERNWSWYMEEDRDEEQDDRPIVGTVAWVYPPDFQRFTVDDPVYNGSGDSPEEALAQAILQALAAQPDPRGD